MGWLTFLYFQNKGAFTSGAVARITPDNVKAYISYLNAFKKSAETVQERLQGLLKAALLLAPSRSWWFIHIIAARLRR